MCKVNQITEQDVDFINQRKCFRAPSQMGIQRQRMFSVVSNCLEAIIRSSFAKMPGVQHLGAIAYGPIHQGGSLERRRTV